jgi:hypothetical protein
MRRPVIGLLSDLGTRDYFIAAMKGTILSINPDVELVDVTHEIPKFNVWDGAFTLVQAAKSFPKGTTFVVVVDPGVGTRRKCILLQTKSGLRFIAPDNGVLTLVAQEFGIDEIRELSNRDLMLSEISTTFHGRDMMAPVAAHLSLGVGSSKVGPKLRKMELLPIKAPATSKGRLVGQVIHIDDFGNIVTNLKRELVSGFRLGNRLGINVGRKSLKAKFARTFGEAPPKELVCYVGSAGLLELAKNRGNAARELKVKIGDEFIIKVSKR